MQPAGAKTTWADYAQTHSYDQAEFEAKRDFVTRAAASRRWKLAWDIGCNTGTFSRIAAEHADSVVAMDGDWMAVESLYRAQQSRPDRAKDPAAGREPRRPVAEPGLEGARAEIAARARQARADPLPRADPSHRDQRQHPDGAISSTGSPSLGTSLVIEFVGRDDEMVQVLLANKDDQYGDYTQENFEALLSARFDIRDSRPLKGGKRVIYFAIGRG